MKKDINILPMNTTAQLDYIGVGNPPSTHPNTAVSNSFPGLEMDFRNVWRRIFEGIVMHEATNLVVDVEPSAPAAVQKLKKNYSLITVDGKKVTGLQKRPPESDQVISFEWSNALAEILPKAGQPLTCVFQSNGNGPGITVDLKVRHFFESDLNAKGEVLNRRAVIASELLEPGELTQSLCSPWQNDYKECACYYWAASRPDYVNIEPTPEGKSIGNNWLEKERNPDTKKYINENANEAAKLLASYIDLFLAWEQNLRFVVGGKDA